MSEAPVQHSGSLPASHDLLDRVEQRLLALGGSVRAKGGAIHGFPQRHIFTPGLYVREFRMAAGSFVTSAIHKTEHPFVVSQGVVSVYDEKACEWQTIRAPYIGITKAGTRRLLVVTEDTVWATFHVTNTTDLDVLEDELVERSENNLTGGTT